MRAPSSLKNDAELLGDIRQAMQALDDAGAVPMFGSLAREGLVRRNIFLGELSRVGIKDPERLAVPSVRNDAAFLFTTVGVTSAVAVVAGVALPGDWGFFVPYLVGGISLAVLAVGSTAPGLLQVFTDQFSKVFPDYRERIVRHEAAHFLAGYLLGVPVGGYSLDLGKEHTDFVEAKMAKRIIEGRLSDDEVNLLAVVAMAGLAAEGVEYDEVIGQTADLQLLERLMARSENKMSDQAKMNLTRWAVWSAVTMLRDNGDAYERLMAVMRRGGSVRECVAAIEGV